MKRVALYCRVSTEEQVKYGFSIYAQIDELRKFAKDNNYTIVDEYIDEGVSGGTLHRPQLDRLLEDVKKDKIDLILFVKLDRWFRSVKHYYKIQEVLDEHNVSWKTTQEDYETQTSSGIFKVNVMLSVNQQFKDATSERIKSVFKYKRANGFYTEGKAPFGYRLEKKDKGNILVFDEEEKSIVEDFIKDFKNYRNVTHAQNYCNEKYNINHTHKVYNGILTNQIYVGSYKDTPNVFVAYLSEEEQSYLRSCIMEIRYHDNKPTYIFKGLLRCAECGNTLTTHMHRIKDKHEYKTYRCTKANNTKQCHNTKTIFETTLEKQVLSVLRDELNKQLTITLEHNKNVSNELKSIDKRKKLEDKINRLNDLYIDGRIDKDSYTKKHNDLKNELSSIKIEDYTIDTNKYEDVLNVKFEDLYKDWNDEQKHVFYMNIVKYIEIDKMGNINIVFL